MHKDIINTGVASEPRAWHRRLFIDHSGHVYSVSFRIGEQATWDHRMHGVDGRELAAAELSLSSFHHWFIQASCDAAVGARRISFVPPAHASPDTELAH